MLFCRQDPDSIFLELIFVDSAVIAAAAESVQLVDDDILERFPGAVGDHAQEIGRLSDRADRALRCRRR